MRNSENRFGYASLRRELASFACDARSSRGRQFSEAGSPTRSEFQRDRDRIIHVAAFRRLQYKTQVFIEHEGDHYRTRLTHTLEVAQIARSLARALRLDEDLAEAVALAHDLGHSPFGHAGERALDRVMAPFGGFDHNAQSLRIVTRLEGRYGAFEGLNLTWETLEGLVKHNGPLMRAALVAEPGEPFDGVPMAIVEFDASFPLELATHSSLEAQIAAIADDIAYNAHDLDDGLRAGLFSLDEIAAEVLMAREIVSDVDVRFPGLNPSRRGYETTRRLITLAIEDILTATAAEIERCGLVAAHDVRNAQTMTARHSTQFQRRFEELSEFLRIRMYRHKRVNDIMERAESVVEALFATFFEDPAKMPPDWSRGLSKVDDHKRARRIADYIAGMTDRFARAEFERLFDRKIELR